MGHLVGRTNRRITAFNSKPLYERLVSSLAVAIVNNNKGYLEFVFDRKRPINEADRAKLLYLAVTYNRINIVRLLLNNSFAATSVVPNKTNSVLEYACARGQHKMALLLLEHGADPNSHNGRALLLAVQSKAYKYIDVIHELISAGADPNAFHGAALSAAAQKGDTDVINILCRSGADPAINNNEALKQAYKHNKHKAILSLLYYGADPNIISEDQNSEIHKLARQVEMHRSGYVQEIPLKSLFCFTYKSQQQKDIEYLDTVKSQECVAEHRVAQVESSMRAV